MIDPACPDVAAPMPTKQPSRNTRRSWEDGIASGDAGPLIFAKLKAEARNKLAETIRRFRAPSDGVKLRE